MVYLTRKIEFSASHLYHNPAFSAEENRRVFGKCNNPHGHGHNYVLEVTVAGEPDPATGMVLDLKELKEILQREVTDRMDHRFLNYEVPELAGQIPTCENIAAVIGGCWSRRLRAGNCIVCGCMRPRTCLWIVTVKNGASETREARDEASSDAAIPFSASHRLHSAQFSEEENQRIYGKCNNPYGHGHNYVVEVAVSGPVDPATGMIANHGEFDAFVEREVIEPYDHKYLNEDVPEFRETRAHDGKYLRRDFQPAAQFPKRQTGAHSPGGNRQQQF